jgi:ribonuclease BN (tRNA processing enzyme)
MHEDRLLAKLEGHSRILLTGAIGAGKSTLAATLGSALSRTSRACACIGCDPGSPAFGVPGAVCLASWREGAWAFVDFEPLCSLDAARFRLPLIQCVARLLERTACERVLFDGPGVVRGVAGAELLAGLVAAARIDVVFALERAGRVGELDTELAALAVPVHRVPAAAEAHAPGKRVRARRRTALWDAQLGGADEYRIDLRGVSCIGTPPPEDAAHAWAGRQVALLRDQECVAFGEAASIEGKTLRARLRGVPSGANALLVRDARRGVHGLLETARPFAADVTDLSVGRNAHPPSAVRGPRPVAKVGPFVAALVNGVFGDPLLLVRLRHGRRCLLFDLGEAGRLPARTAHAVTDVFISHAHIDHIAGFMWFLRSRIGEFPPCRVYGPPGLANNVAGMIAGVHWDRVGERRPRFEVMELHGEHILRFTVSAGCGAPRGFGEQSAPGGTVLVDSLFQVRAAVLDHGTPVLAYALEPSTEIKVRKERLAASGLRPGPWLTKLKQAILTREDDALLELPDGRTRGARALADEFVMVRPGERLAYATDLADTPANRERLSALARDAHTFFCEATFCEPDAARAARTGHLTARACGEIATAAGVQRLIPFHFSRRYESSPARVYREVRAACSRAVVPRGISGLEDDG